MSATYGLYDFDEKEWLDLGKKHNGSFQIEDRAIVNFIAERTHNKIKIIDDIQILPPDKESGWSEIKP